jgi:hypothetical protein
MTAPLPESLENYFLEYPAATLSCCIGYQECQKLCPFKAFFNFGKSSKLQGV